MLAIGIFEMASLVNLSLKCRSKESEYTYFLSHITQNKTISGKQYPEEQGIQCSSIDPADPLLVLLRSFPSKAPERYRTCFSIYIFNIQQSITIPDKRIVKFGVKRLMCNNVTIIKLSLNQVMFPSVVKDENISNKIKEKQWDDRLGPKSNIPEYSPLKDKHTKSYRKMITTKKEDANVTPTKQTKATYFQKRLDLVEELQSLHKSNQNLLEQFQELAGKYKLPNFYIYYALLPLKNTSINITQYLFNEKKELKEQSSHFHKIATAIRAREECLERLRKTIGELTEHQLQNTKTELKEEVDHLRFLTQNAIDEIKRWRDHLGKIDERAVFLTDAQENYLLKILNDNKFIFSSKLGGALSFAEKNDPFLLVPVKRSEGKEASMFTDIVKLPKDVTHYQKYMEYLAGQKAYDLSLNASSKPQQTYKNPVVEKVYKSINPKPQNTINQDQEEEGYHKMDLLKAREDRLKKNEQKMKNIKSIYQTYQKKKSQIKNERQYRSEKKLPETDNEDKRGRKKRSQSIKFIKSQSPSDIQFESLVKVRLEAEKQERKEKVKTPLKRSTSHSNKSQEKMIESLRDIQSTLRNKLQVINQQDKNEVSSSLIMSTSQQKFNKKTNEDLVRQLKAQIMGKIEREAAQKQKLKKLKREQEEKALEEVKSKLKKQMQEKLEQKKKEKILQRQQLQRKLKEQEDRLNNQRQLELQLQLKLNKEKQLRELQKIRRQALQRQKKYKQQLEKEQQLRKERQQTIERERREKERLLEEIRKKEMRDQIEEQLRKQIKSNKKDGSIDLAEQQLIRAQKEAELSKEIQALKLREGVQMQQLKKENQLRERMLKLKKEEQELKRKQIQQLMRAAVQREKEQLQQDTMKQRIELQERMRSNVKEKMLEEYRNEKEAQIDKIKHERQKQMEEEVYRQKIRDKIEREMRMEAIQRTKKELEDRQNKKIEARSKLEQVKSKFDKQVVLDKFKIEEEVKKEMVEKVILDKQAEREAAKFDLRSQFEKELLASALPQLYENKQSSIMVKNINYYEGDLHLESKIQELRPTNQKPQNESPQKKQNKGQVKPLIDSMTLEQLQIYGKQKQKVSQIKEERIIEPTKLPEEEQGFQKLNIDKTNKEEQGYEVKVIRVSESPRKLEKEKSNAKRKKKKESSSEIDSEEEIKKKKKNRRKHRRQYYDQESEEDSEDIAKRKKKEKKRQKSEDQKFSSNSFEQKKSSIKNSKIQSEVKKIKPDEDKKQKIEKPIPKEPSQPIQRESSEKPAVVYYDVENKSKVTPIDPVTIRPQKVSNTAQKFKITLEAIPQAEFDEHLEVHISSVAQIQLSIQMLSREQLYRKLIGQLTFCLLVGQYEGRVVGQALAYHDRARSDLRKFTIVHMATYKEEDLQDFILSVTNYIFRKDPSDQIQFHYKFDQSDQDQLQFSQKFNKWFDKYGSVYQKKVDDTIYERKYVLKRQFNQKCEVVLGGINKNIFRNLFSVYSGVLMSDTDMIQFKEELIDTLSPQNQISYSLMVSQLFRNYLSPDEAESLKNKVKQFVKLKQMLILVVSMQKKKIKLDELKLYEYKNLIELNMRLMSQGKDIIRYCKDTHAELNRIYYAELNQAFNLPFHFQTTSLPVQANNEGQIRQISYFRLSPLPPYKLHIIKSSLYNAEMNILPTENTKYKIFVINAQEYNQIKQSNHLDIFMYIRLFLKNVKSHNVAVWKYVWLPEMTDKGAWNLREFKSFLNKDFYTHDSINISYRQFLPGALIIEPQHRDLVITPPFIVGVMSMSLQQISQGSPLYARMIQINALKTIEVEKQ